MYDLIFLHSSTCSGSDQILGVSQTRKETAIRLDSTSRSLTVSRFLRKQEACGHVLDWERKYARFKVKVPGS